MPFKNYDSSATCPKCGGADVATQYTKFGGMYGQPCEWAEKEDRENEHLHRYCRRCSYRWCEACIAIEPSTTEPPAPKPLPINEHLEKLETLRKAMSSSADLAYWFEKYASAYEILLTQYAPFRVGDRAQLKDTPRITEDNAPGWMGYQHFLRAGARGVVRGVDLVQGRFVCQVEFDDESWIDRDGKAQPVERKHTFCFGADKLFRIVEDLTLA